MKELILLFAVVCIVGCKKDDNILPCTCKAMYLWERKYKDSIYIANDPEYIFIINEVNQIRPKYKYFYYWDTVASPIYDNIVFPFYCKDTFPLGYWIDTINEFNIYSFSRQRLFCID